MYYLTINYNLCDNCGSCEKSLKGFRSKYNGVVSISKHRYFNYEEVRVACENVIDQCECNAIYLEGK